MIWFHIKRLFRAINFKKTVRSKATNLEALQKLKSEKERMLLECEMIWDDTYDRKQQGVDVNENQAFMQKVEALRRDIARDLATVRKEIWSRQ